MKLVAGSYERYLWGWRVDRKKRKEEEDEEEQIEKEKETHKAQHLRQIFSYPAHLGPIKCIASWGSVLATGGADDTIKIFDTNAQRDMGTLMQHTGAVTALSFFGLKSSSLLYPYNLLSGSDDGTVCIWDAEAWLLFKTMKGHKHGVHDLTIHPSGRLALSVGRDSHLNMYNLLKGRHSFTTKLPVEASLVRFSPQDGSIYSVGSESLVMVHNAEDGRPLQSLQHEKRVLCMGQQEDAVLFTGGEDCTVRAWDTRTAELALKISGAHSNRIRGLSVLGSSHTAEVFPFFVATASSDGFVRVWDTRLVKKSSSKSVPSPVMEAETKARLTCLVGCSLKTSGKRTLTVEDGLKGEQTPASFNQQEDDSFLGNSKTCPAAQADQLPNNVGKKRKKKGSKSQRVDREEPPQTLASFNEQKMIA